MSEAQLAAPGGRFDDRVDTNTDIGTGAALMLLGRSFTLLGRVKRLFEKDGDRVTGIVEKPQLESEISAGIYFINPDVLALIPPNQVYNMTELMRALIDDGRSVCAYPLSEYWLDIGQLGDYERAQEDFEKGLI